MLKKAMLLWVLAMVSIGIQASSKQDLTQILDEIWRYELSTNPVFASRLGISDKADKLADVSPQALLAQNKQFTQFLFVLQAIDQSALTRQQQINVLIQQRRLQNYIDQYRFNAHFLPLYSDSGFYSNLAFLPSTMPFKTPDDYQQYLSRLGQFPQYFEQQIYWMKQGLAVGMTHPKAILQGLDDSVKSYIYDTVQDSPFYKPFTQLSGLNISEKEQQALLEEAERVIKQRVNSAYKHFYDFLRLQYIPNSVEKIGADKWPQGKAYYQNRSNYYTTTTMTVEEIHLLGLAEVKRIRAQMQEVVDEVEFDGDINEFIQYLRSEPKFYANSPEDLIKQASYIAKQMDAKLPQLFYTLPRTPYGVQAVPENIAPKYTTGRYISPNRDDQPGYYWVNTYALDKRPLYALTALTLHEAVPGHHLQISLASEMEELPEVRRYTYISAFGEGWGLYSEFLGKEVGMYQNPYDEFGRLSYEMWRACRLVVDTGMHMQGWSRQRAIDYMLENTALSAHNVTTEVDRYISWPGQALSYKIGELSIKKLRTQAEQALGDRFDLRAFHDAVLEYGSVPLSVLEENIQAFIVKHRT